MMAGQSNNQPSWSSSVASAMPNQQQAQLLPPVQQVGMLTSNSYGGALPATAPQPTAQATPATDDYANEVETAKQTYPRFAKYPIALVKGGSGPDYSETYPPDEEGNPKPGNWTIQLRSKEALGDKNTTSQIGLEMIHALYADDPQYQKYTKQFVESMTPSQLYASKRAYQQDLKENPDEHPTWDDWLHRVQAQEYIRGGIFTDVIPGWVGPKGEAGYTPAQTKLLGQIKDYLQTPDDSEEQK